MAESVNTGGLKKFVYDGKMGNSEKYIKETLKNDLMEDYFNNLGDTSIKKKLREHINLHKISFILQDKTGKKNIKSNISIDWEWGNRSYDIKKLLSYNPFIDKFEIELPVGEEYNIEIIKNSWLIFTKILFSENIKLTKDIKKIISF